MFLALSTAVAALATIDAEALSDSELEEGLVVLAREQARLAAAKARLLATYAVRRAWAAEGARSPGAALAARTRQDPGPVKGEVRQARRLRSMPATAAAYAAGTICADHVRRLAALSTGRTAAAFAEAEAVLVGWAEHMRWPDFSEALTAWRLAADPDGADADEFAKIDRRRCDTFTTDAGVTLGRFTLDPVSGEIVTGELGRIERELFDADWSAAKARLGRDPLATELDRTATQRRADALVRMAERSRRATEGGSARGPLFTVVFGPDHLERLCRLGSGVQVSPAALTRFTDRATVEAFFFSDGGGPVYASSQRTFTGTLRRVVEARDRRCRGHDTCDVPASRCDIDHIVAWSDGGATTLDNARAACPVHNRWLYQQRPRPGPARADHPRPTRDGRSPTQYLADLRAWLRVSPAPPVDHAA